MAQANKTVATKASVATFLKSIQDPQRRKDAQRLATLMRTITGEAPCMWGPSIVGFGSYHYVYASGREGDMCALGFSPRKTGLTIYLVDGTARYARERAKLGPHTVGKVCLYVKRLDDLSLSVLERMLRASYARVRARDGTIPA